ncbi:NAD(P)-binding protein [Plenodomus tracheiphilus IPT5]|uniref:NAD(P)-binding protein n=1 Tax=Plenodomus tracheiphilus IPT5 TaxID=1408161 RepID=A0A6A7B6D0_9PLEO|nr:NAD(P)-binding protein [Plenodomus tracheiphilus IPT5]
MTIPLNIGVIGPAGFGGSYLCVELLNRGHNVQGISRFPERLGTHQRYTTRSVDISTAPTEDIADAFKGVDVLINQCGPHTSGENALVYQPFLELTRKIVLAIRAAQVPYFIMIGGCGSLHMPGKPYQSVCESPDWWLAYRRGIADSHAHVSYMEERLGSLGTNLRDYRNARAKLKSPHNLIVHKAQEARRLVTEYEAAFTKNDRALTFVTACRTSFMFFDGNTAFRWTYVSPSALYRPGKRTGFYEILFDELALKPKSPGHDALEGRLHGITAADLAIAIADEAEKQEKVGRHWTAYADLSDDTPHPSYVSI